jgi:hypothetical protein
MKVLSRSAKELNSIAYSVGNKSLIMKNICHKQQTADIRLITHELPHVVQQIGKSSIVHISETNLAND